MNLLVRGLSSEISVLWPIHDLNTFMKFTDTKYCNVNPIMIALCFYTPHCMVFSVFTYDWIRIAVDILLNLFWFTGLLQNTIAKSK